MKISTKTGDDGTTNLRSGERVPKSDARIDFVGTVDELNSHLGLLRAKASTADAGAEFRATQLLKKIQQELIVLGAGGKPATLPEIEAAIEQLEAELPPLTEFILPGDNELSAQAHVARSICRRAERLSPAPSPFLNRLSDYLFLLARKYATI